MYIPRISTHKIKKLASLYPIVLVTGARQTGKTELVKHIFPRHQWVLLDKAALIEQAKNDPALFLQNHPWPVIIDEIQRAPELFLEIKSLVDENNPPKGSIILTGSQPFSLIKEVSDSLAGRIGILSLPGMLCSELFRPEQKPFNLEKWLYSPPIGGNFPWKETPLEFLLRGSFPAMALKMHSPHETDAAIRLNDYIQTYLNRDLRELAQVKNLGRFERFLRYFAACSGKTVNLNAIARDIQIPQTTLQEWISLLQAAHLYWELPAFHPNPTKREAKRPKSIMCDAGLILNLLGYQNHNQIKHAPVLGAVFETAAINAVKSLALCEPISIPLYHWRLRDQDEVDLVITWSNSDLFPVEIKLTANPMKKSLSGLLKFMHTFKNFKKGIVISTNEECFYIQKNVLHIPLSAI